MSEFRLTLYLIVIFLYFTYKTIHNVLSEVRYDTKKLVLNLVLALTLVVIAVMSIYYGFHFIWGM